MGEWERMGVRIVQYGVMACQFIFALMYDIRHLFIDSESSYSSND